MRLDAREWCCLLFGVFAFGFGAWAMWDGFTANERREAADRAFFADLEAAGWETIRGEGE